MSRILWLALALAALLPACAAEPEPAAPRLVVLEAERDLGMTAAVTYASMAVHPGGRRVYLGRYGSYDPARRDLTVVHLDEAGAVTGRVEVAVAPRPAPPATAVSVTSLALSPDAARLYLTLPPIAGETEAARETLAVLDLDAAGDPRGPTRVYDLGLPPASAWALALHPAGHLYLGGYGDQALHMARLEGGEPSPALPVTLDHLPVDGGGIASLTLDAERDLLHVGGTELLETYHLAPDGSSATRVARVALPGAGFVRPTLAEGALVLRGPALPAGAPAAAPLTLLRLDEGLPAATIDVGLPLVDAVGLSSGELLALLERPFADALTGAEVVADLGLAVGPPDLLSGPAPALPEARVLYDRQGVLAAAAGTTAAVLVARRPSGASRFSDLRLRARLDALEVGGLPTADPQALHVLQVQVVGTELYETSELAIGGWSRWHTLDPALRGRAHSAAAYLALASEASAMWLTVEVAIGDPAAGGQVLDTVEVSAQGPEVLVRVPGLGLPEGERRAQSELELTREHLDHARAVGLAPDERPRLMSMGCYSIIGMQAEPALLEAHADLVASLGCNTLEPIAWERLAPGEVRRILEDRGIDRRAASSYTPPSYFRSELDDLLAADPEALATWASDTLRWALTDGSPPSSLARVTIADEPNWYYPTELERLLAAPARLGAFRAFLAERGLDPAELGAATLDEALPLGKPTDTTGLSDTERARLYWTLRFFAVDAARGLGDAAEAMRRTAGWDVPVHVNWNNWGLSAYHYNAWPGTVENNPAEVGPGRGTGSVDWFEAGRLQAHELFTEDWVPDTWADLWSYRLDTLRSAARGRPTGAYLIPIVAGQMKDGFSYKLLSAVGRGVTHVDLFNYGPTALQSDGWSDLPVVYEPIARAFGRLARAEAFLVGATPEPRQVAIMLPYESLYFDEWAETDYTFEAEHLHRALVHAGFGVDVLDADDLAAGHLDEGYGALYLTAPNVPEAAAAAVARWVEAGGTLIVSPGAATADAYDRPSAALDLTLGLGPRSRERAPGGPPYAQRPYYGAPPSATLADGAPVYGAIAALAPDGAEVVAAFADGRPAITAHAHGAGRAWAYAFWPGMQYALALPRERSDRLPAFAPHADEARALAVRPAREADARGSVTLDREGVEVLRLDGPRGVALVLLDWTGRGHADLRLVIGGAAALSKVRSVEGARVTTRALGPDRELVLERLEAVEVLLLEP